MNLKKTFITLGVLIVALVIVNLFSKPAPSSEPNPIGIFEQDNLATNTDNTLIPLEEILSGGPTKDGIPSLEYPTYTSIENADQSITDDVEGVLITAGDEAKFYPYNILVWHEIVNDEIGGEKIAVTFCPLCGSAVVYKRIIDGQEYEFGVSGKLWQSNLLMYDRTTESLWSQIEGRAVVGDLASTELEHYPLQLVSFADVKNAYPSAQILSTQTGYARDYTFYPYGDYETNNDEFYFPVNNFDTRLPAKTLMYASVVNDEPVAFVREKLLETKSAQIETQSGNIRANVSEYNEITLTDENGNIYPGYVTMWFSWANHNEGPVWE